ncbi:AEC family transporter [Puniceicoccaceae bacterium K14]|nr:AEC family transporter [Puniceicoccaceae bacterium K14]
MNSIETVLLAVVKIAIVVSISGFLVRKRVVAIETIRPLSSLVVTFFLPSLILSNILEKFDTSESTDWWYMPLSGLGLCAIGLVVALVGPPKVLKERRELIPASFLQNAAFLVLPLAQSLLSDSDFDTFSLTVFLFLVGYNPMLWLFGKHFMRPRESDERFAWKNVLSTPLVSCLSAIFLVLTGIRNFIPDLAIETLSFVGGATVPVATFILGATLGGMKIDFRKYWKDTLFVSFKKLIVVPAIALLLMTLIPWTYSTPLISLLLILQASSPPATSLAIQCQAYGGNTERIASILLGSYILCIFTIPMWILIMQKILN